MVEAQHSMLRSYPSPAPHAAASTCMIRRTAMVSAAAHPPLLSCAGARGREYATCPACTAGCRSQATPDAAGPMARAAAAPPSLPPAGTGKLEGRSEQLLGRFLDEYPGSAATRDSVRIATKLAAYPWRLTPQQVRGRRGVGWPRLHSRRAPAGEGACSSGGRVRSSRRGCAGAAQARSAEPAASAPALSAAVGVRLQGQPEAHGAGQAGARAAALEHRQIRAAAGRSCGSPWNWHGCLAAVVMAG